MDALTVPALVSCVMPTRNRRRFAEQSIWYFLRQDYPDRELVIVDDGDDAIGDVVPADERIRYIRLEERASLAKKRNLGCASARGELVAHWDDDDWIGYDRLSIQVKALEDADVCGADELLHYRLEAGEAWLRKPQTSGTAGMADCTLAYRRSVWEASPFSDAAPTAHSALRDRVPPERVCVLTEPEFYVALLHRDNNAPADLGLPGWERRPVEEVSQRLGFDREFYAALRNGTGMSATAVAPSRVASVTVAAPIVVYDGYGSMSEYLIRGLARAGAQVNVVPLALDTTGISDELRDILARSRPDRDAPSLFFSWPNGDVDRHRSPDFFINTMWESSRLPESWPAQLNRARTVIVPTRFVARVCRASGVEAPLEVIPEGIDAAVYHYEPRAQRPGLTTLVVGTLVARKNVDIAVAAWRKAFEDDPDARLLIKARFGYNTIEPGDARIQLVDSNETTRGIAHWYRRADVLLALGSEGFGLPLVEGMATGLPVIAMDAGGQADTCADAGDLVLTVKPRSWRVYDEPTFGRCGTFGAPEVAEVADRLRWVATHRDEAAAIGRAAAEWAPRARNVWEKGPAVLSVLEQRCRPSRALRRMPTLWVPSWGQPCGVADTTAELVARLPGVRVTSTSPDLATARVLHVQHEPSLFSEGELVESLAEAAAVGVRTAVTEHAVLEQPSAFERQASLLATTTDDGARRLRTRWPDKWVEHLPLGCPCWFPPRKRDRGRVIGYFGFVEPHKGLRALADALRNLQDARLLLFGHAKTEATRTELTDVIAGLDVDWIEGFLPSEEIARRLAAEADVLAFWYDPPPYPTASAAARLGLATGVPVLTSPTGWFADLTEVTYQPDGLVDGLATLFEDTALRHRVATAARHFCHDQSYARIAQRHRALWQTLEST